MYSLILPTYKNPEYLKLCINSILENSYYKTHQLCVHINGYDQESIDYLTKLNNKNIIYTISQDNIGLSKATNVCIKNAIYDKVLPAADDNYFSKNWDYNLHQWEIELNKKYPEYIHLISYRYCEPYAGSFLPICDAGKDINNFNVDKFNEYVKKYSEHDAQSWLSNSLCPKNLYINPEDFDFNLCDIDFTMKLLKYLKDNNTKYLMFCAKDCLAYHFGSISSKKTKQRYEADSSLDKKFENKWKMNVNDAYHKVLKPECDRSIKMVKEMLKETPTLSKSITYCMMGFNSLHEIKPYLESVISYIDRFIYIDGGSTDGTIEYLSSFNNNSENNNKIEFYIHEWKDNFPEQRNNYLKHFKEKQNSGWILVSDTDEHFTIETLQNLRKIIDDATLNKFNGVKFLAYDIIIDDNNNNKIIEDQASKSNFYKPLMFKYDSSIKYIGSAHETIVGQIKWKEVNFTYQHIHSQRKIYERAVQNFWIYVMILKSSKWKDFRILCLNNKLSKFRDFFNLYKSNTLPNDIIKWLQDHRNYKIKSNELELLELRDTSNYYFMLQESKNKKEQPIKQRSTISTYITTINALFYQSTLEQTIHQAALFSDEIIIVNSEYSTDGTQNLLNNLKNKYPDKIKVFTFKEDYSKKWDTVTEKKTFALKQCTGDYCILQDDDECIHEKYVETIKQLPIQYPNALAFRFNTIHFYRSYDRYQNKSGWYQKKIYMVKNIPEIQHGKVNDDPDNHIIQMPITHSWIPLDSVGKFDNQKIVDVDVTSYHYGWCRNDAILLMKKYNQEIQWWGEDYWNQPNHKFPFKFDNPNNLPKFEGTHPTYMQNLINNEENLNSMHIKEFEKEPKEIIFNGNNEYINVSNKKNVNYSDKIIPNNNNIKVSACIITRNESERIKDTVLHVYPYVDEIIINDASDDDKTKNECLNTDHHFKIKYFKTEKTSNFAEERNKMHNLATGDYCLHIDTDERFNVEFLKDMKNIIKKYLDKNTLPMMFRFPRSNVELDMTKDPDYQIRFVNRLYVNWTRNVHEIPFIIKENTYNLYVKNMIPVNLTFLDKYVIEHLSKDRILIRERWNTLMSNSKQNDVSTNLNTPNKINSNRKLLICSMFKNSSLWINEILLCINNIINYNNSLHNNSKNKLIINLAFLKSTSTDKTCEMLDKYIKESDLNIQHYKFDSEIDETLRYKKLADLRNYLITTSIKDIYNNNLNDDDLILFMDSDVKFDNNIIHELITDMNVCNADIIAPLICIDNNGAFKDNYFYDILAFRNSDNEKFSHFKPYIFGEIKKSTIKKEKDEKRRKGLEKIDELNVLRKINWEFNLNTPLINEFPDYLYAKAYELLDSNIPIEVNSVGSFYIMKYKVAKNVKYTGIKDSEQVEFMNTAQSKGYKIFVSQRLKVLHVNLEKYGLKWH